MKTRKIASPEEQWGKIPEGFADESWYICVIYTIYDIQWIPALSDITAMKFQPRMRGSKEATGYSCNMNSFLGQLSVIVRTE